MPIRWSRASQLIISYRKQTQPCLLHADALSDSLLRWSARGEQMGGGVKNGAGSLASPIKRHSQYCLTPVRLQVLKAENNSNYCSSQQK